MVGTAVVVVAGGAAILVAALTPSPTTTSVESPSTAPRIIIDSDLSRWWDDATARGMANVLEQRGAVRILGIMSDIRNPLAVAAIDAIDTAMAIRTSPWAQSLTATPILHPTVTAMPGSTSFPIPSARATMFRKRWISTATFLRTSRITASPSLPSVPIRISAGLLRSTPGQGSSLDGRALVQAKVKRLVIEDGLFPNGAPPVTNQKFDLAAASAVVTGTNWPTPMAWVDGFVGIQTKVGGALCSSVRPSNPMRIAYQWEFGCGPPGDGDWDGPTLLYAIWGKKGMFSELGQGGAAYINAQGGLSWRTDPSRAHDVYFHVTNQMALNRQINELLVAK